jgi:hypothetical protein
VFTLTQNGFVNGLSEYQSEDYFQPKPGCFNHPHKIFDTYINKELVDEWNEEFNGGEYCVCLDILIQSWEEFHDPTAVYKKHGYYDVLKELVHNNKVSGTFYHGNDYYKLNDLNIGSIIDYSSRITSWCLDQNKVKSFLNEENIVLKLTGDNMTGLFLKGDYGYGKEIMLGECQLKVINKTKMDKYNIIEVKIQ